MAEKVIMPKAGMAMEEGKIIRWLKKEGDRVEKGEPLLEIETDKVTMEIEATESGYLVKILKGEGETVPVTRTIAYIGEKNEKIEEAVELSSNRSDKDKADSKNNLSASANTSDRVKKLEADGDRIAATPLAKTLAAQKGIDLRKIKGTGSLGEIKARDVQKASIISATPLAERIAKDKGIDISTIEGSGYKGKVRKEDILRVEKVKQHTQEAKESSRVPLKGIRKVIADRMVQSHLQIPPVTLNAKADVTELFKLRKRLNDSIEGYKITFNDFVLKAVAVALSKTPSINASIEGDEIVYKQDINIGMAVALEDGLIVPVIKNADKLSLRKISQRAKELANRAREGKLSPDEYSGGTFTVSNMGMYGIVSFTPIINPPESAILGVCAIEEELKMVEDQVEKRKVMGLSLTFDHRIVDGAQSAIFLNKIKALLENPLELLVY